jgi:Ion transport protein
VGKIGHDPSPNLRDDGFAPNLSFREKLKNFTESSEFIAFTTFFIVANTITLAMDKYPQTDEYENTLEYFNIIFTIAFSTEMTLKIIALGFNGYLRDSFNIFDGSLVILSLVDLILS